MKNTTFAQLICSILILSSLLISCNKDQCDNDDNVVFNEINKTITASGTSIGVGKETEIDLDSDGVKDVVMTAFYSYFDGKSYRGINNVQLYIQSDTAFFFQEGKIIDSTAVSAEDNTIYSNAKDAGLIGFSIQNEDGVHYGWFRADGASTLNLPLVSVSAIIYQSAINKNNQGIAAGYTGICE